VSEAVAERAPLPTGTVTFLFSDIEGSTERWERHREDMKAAVAWHDTIMRRTIENHGGHIFKTMGDAFCAAFKTVPQAIEAALDAQRAIENEDWSKVGGIRVRMALHTGLADERDGDYFGPTVNRVARLLSIGHGGQVLVSGVSTELAQGMMPTQATLRDLGAHRLRDLIQPEQVYQLVAPGLPAEFPPLRSLDALPNNLPIQLTQLVGRESDLAEIESLLAKHRLITLVGAGGVGKTRLSLQVGAEVLDRFEDGVWFVDLAPLNDPSFIPSRFAEVFNFGEAGDRSLDEVVTRALQSRQLLIILDNCEHLVSGAARMAELVLRGCPNVRILASSREGLGIEGEIVVRVPSLAVPAPEGELSATDASRFGSIALFAERAAAGDRRFALTDKNAPVIARICEQLDGIPLAIEMAAARVKVLSVEQLAARLEDRFRILTASNRSALPRQQTMRALIDWSYDLLSDNEKTVFRRLSVFAGGCTLDAASSVCSDAALDPLDVLDLLTGLVDKSLVVTELVGSEQRYRLLASTRQYASELLEKSGEPDLVRARHAEFYRSLAEQAEDQWASTPTRVWTERLLPDIDNFRSALDWAVTARHDVDLGALLAASLAFFWASGPQPEEGRRRLAAAIVANPGVGQPKLEAKLQAASAHLELRAWRYEPALVAGKRARELYDQLGDRYGAAWASSRVGEALLRMRQHEEAERVLESALQTFNELGSSRMIAMVISQKARNYHFQQRHEEGLELYNQALAYARTSGDIGLVDAITSNVAEVEFRRGNVERALDIARSLLAGQPAWERISRALLQANMAAYLIFLNRFDEAREFAREAIKDARPAGPVTFAESVQHFAAIAAGCQDWQQSARLLGYCKRAYADLGTHLDFTEQQEYDKLMAVLAENLKPEALKALLAEGATWDDDRVYNEALKV
jgi:predicted ATPase/class 3 adenylate cyclase